MENPPVCRDMGIMVVSSGQSPMNQFIELGTVQADKLQIIELVNTSPTNCRDTYVHGLILQRAFVAVERLSLPRLLHFIIDPGNLSFRPLPFPLRCWSQHNTHVPLCEEAAFNWIHVVLLESIYGMSPGYRRNERQGERESSIRFQITSHSFSLPANSFSSSPSPLLLLLHAL